MARTMPVRVAGEHQDGGLVGHELLHQRPGGDDRPGFGVDGQRRSRLAQAPVGVLSPGDRQAQGDILAAGQPLAECEYPFGLVEDAELV
jgi:hypothetical protein